MSSFASLEALQLDTAFLRYDVWGARKEMKDVHVREGPVLEYGMTSAFLWHDRWSECCGGRLGAKAEGAIE